MENKKHEILLGLTTTPASDWRGKVEEMKKFGIKRIALFPTFLELNERKELYALLDEIENLEIPHVHLRGQDMEKWEFDWFESHGTVVYNIHAGEPDFNILKPFLHKTYVENHFTKAIPRKNIEDCAGICFDFQHLQVAKKSYPEVAKKIQEYIDEFNIGCCHMSPLPKWKNFIPRLFLAGNSSHYMISLDEMDYIEQYSKYFPKLMSIEMENSFEEQLEVKRYLEKMLNI